VERVDRERAKELMAIHKEVDVFEVAQTVLGGTLFDIFLKN
jgi:hypothetical protein